MMMVNGLECAKTVPPEPHHRCTASGAALLQLDALSLQVLERTCRGQPQSVVVIHVLEIGIDPWSVRTQRSPNATWHPGLSEGDERTRTAGGGFADPWLNHLPTSPESGRRDSNPRLSAWEADILPLNYSRAHFSQRYSTESQPACQA